jgi:hypothetical protein
LIAHFLGSPDFVATRIEFFDRRAREDFDGPVKVAPICVARAGATGPFKARRYTAVIPTPPPKQPAPTFQVSV